MEEEAEDAEELQRLHFELESRFYYNFGLVNIKVSRQGGEGGWSWVLDYALVEGRGCFVD